MKILIRNMARSITEKELRSMFEVYGAVQSCTLVLDTHTGASKGFGFIEMPKPGEAKAALRSLNGTEVSGSLIRVKKAETSNEKTDSHTSQSKDPLHGITLETLLARLVEKYGWESLGNRISIKCFTSDPSISSSLKFLRKTPWARKKVEQLFLDTNWSTQSVWKLPSGKNK